MKLRRAVFRVKEIWIILYINRTVCMGFVGMCSFRTQLAYNSPGGYSVHILFFDLSFFQLTVQGGFSENPGMAFVDYVLASFCQADT